MVCEGLAGCPPPTQLAVCQLRHRQDLSLSALCALACSYTASAVQIAVRILVLFYTVNFTTYSSKVDYTILTLVPRQDTIL